MGLRINFEHANWLAYVLDPGSVLPPAPPLDHFSEPGAYTSIEDNAFQERELIRHFLYGLEGQLYSDRSTEMLFNRQISHYLQGLDRLSSSEILSALRSILGNRPWTGLLLPSFRDTEMDEPFTSPQFLRELIEHSPENDGLILQLEEAEHESGIQQCRNIFPAMRTALAEMTKWPGLLLWNKSNSSAFFSLEGMEPRGILERCWWLFDRLGNSIAPDLQRLKQVYNENFNDTRWAVNPPCHILQISDIHLGSPEATRRLPRLKRLVADTIEELGPQNVIPVVSGDILNTPSHRLCLQARDFMDYVRDCSAHPPFFVLGNHDMSSSGYGLRNFSLAKHVRTKEIKRYPQHGLTLVGFDSCESNFLASGSVSEEQLLKLGNELDREQASECPIHVGIVHHHPIPVDWPDWQRVSRLERLLHRFHEPTVAFKNAESFMRFVEARKFAAVLHGHKHIPRIVACPSTGIPIFGCGSSVGKIPTLDGSIRLSINIVTLNRSNKTLSCRLMMETVPGGGLQSHKNEIFSVRDAEF